MKKLISMFMTAALLVASLSACQSSSQPSQNQGDGGDTPGTIQSGNWSGAGWDSTDNPTVTAYVVEPPSGLSETAVPDTLTVGLRSEPSSLYPQGQNDQPSAVINLQMYEPLIYFNHFNNEYEGQLAESWEFTDDVTIRIKLRQDVVSHSGTPFTAHDVLWTAQQGFESSKAEFIWGAFDVSKFEVIDDHTIDIVTDGAFSPAVSYLSNLSVATMVCRDDYEAQTPEEYSRNPTGGTGPWKFVEWVAGDRVVMERFEEYYGDKPYYKNLVIRNITDDVSRALSLESGDIDVCIDVAGPSCEAIISAETANLITIPSYIITYAAFNTEREPFNVKEVRQAMRAALDLDSMVEIAFAGMAAPADGPFAVSTTTAYRPPAEGEGYTYDLELAKELLAEAGYADGFEFEFWTNENAARIDLAEMFQNAWSEIGVTANVQVMDFNTMIEATENGEHDVFMMGFSPAGDDGDYIHDQYHSEYGYTRNRSQYKNPEYDRLIDTARASMDPDERRELYSQVQEILREDQPWIWIANTEYTYAVRSTLKGIEPAPNGFIKLCYVRPITVE